MMDIQDILKQLEVNEGTFPREAVAQAIEQREAITPELLRVLEYAHHNVERLSETGYMTHLYAMYLLAQFREPRAYPLIVQFFSTPGEITLDMTGDVVTEGLGRILASVACGDISLITTLVENEQANEYVRNAGLTSLVVMVACGEQDRDDVITYFQKLFRSTLVRQPSYIWDGLVSASATLYPQEVYAHIKQAYLDRLLDPYTIRLEYVENVLSRDKALVLSELNDQRRFTLIGDTIREMEWWACFQPKDRPSHIALSDIPFPTLIPVIQLETKKSKSRAKDIAKRKQARASRRKNRR
jgi:hypothetical protein